MQIIPEEKARVLIIPLHKKVRKREHEKHQHNKSNPIEYIYMDINRCDYENSKFNRGVFIFEGIKALLDIKALAAQDIKKISFDN